MNESVRLDELIHLLYPWALGLGFVLSRKRDQAEDLVQDALVQLFKHPPQPLTLGVVRPWLRTTILRLYLRKRSKALRELSLLRRIYRNRESELSLSETSEGLLIALGSLTPRQKACIVLRYLEDLSEKQTADVLGLKVGSVKAHLAAGRERLRENWKPIS